eukprot:scaffold27248_cov133-Isochrysis_galbana.AAC.2
MRWPRCQSLTCTSEAKPLPEPKRCTTDTMAPSQDGGAGGGEGGRGDDGGKGGCGIGGGGRGLAMQCRRGMTYGVPRIFMPTSR